MAGGQGRDMRGREVHREQTLGGRGAPARVRLNAERLAFQEPPCPLWEQPLKRTGGSSAFRPRENFSGICTTGRLAGPLGK